jgi:hypothetical protein
MRILLFEIENVPERSTKFDVPKKHCEWGRRI